MHSQTYLAGIKVTDKELKYTLEYEISYVPQFSGSLYPLLTLDRVDQCYD
ncbi:MAG: hypothetical protein NVSMB33_10180 [Ktedonobacteraceae bacterium]